VHRWFKRKSSRGKEDVIRGGGGGGGGGRDDNDISAHIRVL
jgi:hypothetical protein